MKNKIGKLLLTLGLCALSQVTEANGFKDIVNQGFNPSIPSASSGALVYTYEFWATPYVDVSGLMSSALSAYTMESGTITVGSTTTTVVSRANVKTKTVHYDPCGVIAPSQCSLSQTQISYPSVSYTPSSGVVCAVDYAGGGFFNGWTPAKAYDSSPLVTQTISGTGWYIEYTHPSTLPYMYFLNRKQEGCGGGVYANVTTEGWGSYYKIVVHVNQGVSTSTIPLPSLPSGGSTGGDSYTGSSADFFEIYSPSFNGSSQYQFQVQGLGSAFAIEKSSDLATWTSLSSSVPFTGSGQVYTDTTSSGSTATRFYRITPTSVSNYGVNTLGFNRISKASGKNLILLGSQFKAGDNSLAALVPSVPNGTVAYVGNPGTASYLSSTFSSTTGWSDPNLVVNLGSGFWLSSSGAISIPLYGVVTKGTTSVTLPQVQSLMGSPLPKADTLPNLGFPLIDGDNFYRWDVTAQNYVNYQYFNPGGWSPSAPSLGISEGFIYDGRATPTTWSQTY